jgi:Xaa-Pro aminopeptidase
MDADVIRQRLINIRKQLKKKGITYLVVTKPANVTYLTGFLGGDSWAVIDPQGVYLLTDSRYTEQARGECRRCKITERKRSMPEAAAALLKKLKSSGLVRIEKSSTLTDFAQLRKFYGRIKISEDIIESVRSCKDASEVAAIKAAARIAAKALGQTLRYIKPQISENALAGMLDFQIRKAGACNSFETIVAFGANASRPHHQPTNRKLKKNDTVLIDFGARYKGYCCDLTRCFAVGTPSAFYKKVYSAVQEAQAAAIKMIRAGVEIADVDATAREVIAGYKLPVYGHGTGHGLGLEVHEAPVVAKKRRGKLQAGNVITIEPGVYIPGRLGVRIEDDILVTDTGCRLLSSDCPQFFSLPH